MRLILAAVVLLGALAAGAASTCSTSIAPKVAAQDGGFGRGYSVYHSYGWARGVAGYGQGACYWQAEACAKDED
jgi:hypothetical protein